MIRTIRQTKQSGFTLLELLLYMFLFTLIMTGTVMAAFQVLESSDRTQARIVADQEAAFVLRKLDWLMSGAMAITATATSVTVANPTLGAASPVTLALSGTEFRYTETGAAAVPLTSSAIKVGQTAAADVFAFDAPTKTLTVKFSIGSLAYEQQKFLRP